MTGTRHAIAALPAEERHAIKIYVVSPRLRTGGPSVLHRLCNELNRAGADASVVYATGSYDDNLYPELADVRVATEIRDDPGTVIVIPEVYPASSFADRFPNSTVTIYWLSFFNAGITGVLRENLERAGRTTHLFHSYYEYAMIRPHLPALTRYLTVEGPIGDEFLELDPYSWLARKENIVCFNATKDIITPVLCEDAGFEHIGIAGMSTAEVMRTLRRCKVYVDLGFHPGTECIPREAAMSGCVVVTNKCGSAAYAECVPIEEKVVREPELYDLIPAVFADYDRYFEKQSQYRDFIRGQKAEFERQVRHFLDTMDRVIS